ncbi:MAG: histidine kinase [Bacteroidota bacterium]
METFLLTHSSWAFLSVLLVVALSIAAKSAQHSWGHFLTLLFSLVLLFIPVLLYSHYRAVRSEEQATYRDQFFWAYAFVLHPLLLLAGRHFLFDGLLWLPSHPSNSLQADTYLLMSIGGSLLLVECLLWANQFLLQKGRNLQWMSFVRLEPAILLGMLLLSTFAVFATNKFQQGGEELSSWARGLQFVSYVLQYFLLLLPYYGLYWINHYLLISKVLRRKGFLYYLLSLLALLFVSYPLIAQYIYFLPIVHELKVYPLLDGRIFKDIHFITPALGLLATIPFILAYQWFQKNSKIAALEQEKTATELRLLKQQINPHFFFNTLNNLYALSIRQAAETPQVLLQLSQLMRYVIYKGQKESVALKEEIKYLNDYIQLQQIRLHKSLDLRFEHSLEDEQLQVPPLLFIVLVENAFKHGIEPAEKDCHLHIQMKTEGQSLEFHCENSFEEASELPGGVGLDNLRRRLALLFPDRHELILSSTENTFTAIAKLQL